MAFGINFFNKKEAPKKTGDTSIVEKAQEVAGNATDLSLKAAALASLIAAGGHTMAAEKMDKDQAPINKIEMSATQSTPKSMENTISFEDAQKLRHEIDSIKSVKKDLEKHEDDFEMKIFNNKSVLNNIINLMPTGKEYVGIYDEVEKFIRESSKNYDLNTADGFKKFREDMSTQENGKAAAVNPEIVKNTNPTLAKKLVAFSVDYNQKTRFGFDDLKIRESKIINEHNMIVNIINDILAEKKISYEEIGIIARQSKLDSTSNNITASK